MASVVLDPAYRRVSVEEFLDMDFGDAKAELEDGLIYMMAGGSEVHPRLAANVLIALRPRLRGSGCRPYGSDFGVRTGEQTIRYPDISVHCAWPGAPGNENKKLIGDPAVVVEVLSPSTAAHDQRVKLAEYQALDGITDIVFVDPQQERIRHVRRTAPRGWADDWLDDGANVVLATLGITLPHVEIFARD